MASRCGYVDHLVVEPLPWAQSAHVGALDRHIGHLRKQLVGVSVG